MLLWIALTAVFAVLLEQLEFALQRLRNSKGWKLVRDLAVAVATTLTCASLVVLAAHLLTPMIGLGWALFSSFGVALSLVLRKEVGYLLGYAWKWALATFRKFRVPYARH